MANCIITNNDRIIKLEFNDESVKSSIGEAYINKGDFNKVSIELDGSVRILFKNKNYFLTTNGVGNTIQVDTVDGVVPTNNADLASKLIVFIGGING